MKLTIRTITLALASSLLLAACKKDNAVQYPWAINFNDGTKQYQFVGNSNKEVRYGDRAVFEASVGYGRLPNGQLVSFTVSSGFDTYNGNPEKMGLGIRLLNWDTAFLRRIDPANTSNTSATRIATLQQWLTNRTFRLSPTTNELSVYYKDVLGEEWVEDFNSTGQATVTDISPYILLGYSQSLRANIQFTINLVRYSNTAPYTILGRKTINGNLAGFFTLDQ